MKNFMFYLLGLPFTFSSTKFLGLHMSDVKKLHMLLRWSDHLNFPENAAVRLFFEKSL